MPTLQLDRDHSAAQSSSARCVISEEVADKCFSGVALLVEGVPGTLKAWLHLNKTDQCSFLSSLCPLLLDKDLEPNRQPMVITADFYSSEVIIPT